MMQRSAVPFAALLASWFAVAAFAADVHLSPTGDDAADGSAEKPVATLRRALDRVREIRTADRLLETPVEIAVAEGRYELDGPVVIGHPRHRRLAARLQRRPCDPRLAGCPTGRSAPLDRGTARSEGRHLELQ
jgi:hypothetical protein